MLFAQTTATKKIARLSKRYRAIQGGTSASKTISILLVLIAEAQTETIPTLTSIVSESMPHMKKGAMRDFLNIMQAHGYYEDKRWNRSDYIYTFPHPTNPELPGSKIEFFSVDSPDKTRGPRRDKLFMNEANNIQFEAFNQLEVRTKKVVWMDWNPTNEFWFYSDVLNNPELAKDLDYLTITYIDNEALDAAIVRSIEARRINKSWWKVYGEGQLGEVEGKIYRGWKLDVEEIPHEARLERRGMDFGYSNDPTAIVDIYYWNGAYIFDEILYRKGMTNKQISDFLNNQEQPHILTIADSAEPKSIEEIAQHGVPIIPTIKGQGSINTGIDFVRDQQIFVTKRSVNLIKEYRNYLWATDKEGRILNIPEDMFNHTMDALRYGMATYRPKPEDEAMAAIHEPDITSLIY
jgi:phage terminase large subunit